MCEDQVSGLFGPFATPPCSGFEIYCDRRHTVAAKNEHVCRNTFDGDLALAASVQINVVARFGQGR